MPRTQGINPQILHAALEVLEARRRSLAAQIAEVRKRLDKSVAVEAPIPDARPIQEAKSQAKRRLSPAGRKAIAEAARKRWAARRKGEKQEAKRQAEIRARRTLAMAKARNVLAAKRKAAKKAAAKKVAKRPSVKKASAPAKAAPRKAAAKPETRTAQMAAEPTTA